MNKNIYKSLALGILSLTWFSCNESMEDLLEPKVYFDKKEYNLTIEDGDNMSFELSSRLTSALGNDVNVQYSIADTSVVHEYNAKYGTNYQFIGKSNIALSSNTAKISGGELYSDRVNLEFNNLSSLEEGVSYVLPVIVESNDVSTNPGGNIAYFLLKKPVRIMNVGTFRNSYISIRFPAGTFFTSFTYETLLYINNFIDNQTIMGTEGVMILRIGDMTLPSNKILELAGRQHYNVKEDLKKGQWYHVAATFDQPTGKTAIYVNGEKWAESNWSIPGFDPNSDVGFNIGMLPGFQWGERPINAYMGEIRVWSVARTQNQIKQNMFLVDPKSEGLEVYYRLNGSETIEGRKIKDATGKIEGTTGGIQIRHLDTPVEIK